MSEILKGKFKGKKASNYIDGRTQKKYCCKNCGKEISLSSGCYGLERCQPCSKRYLWNNKKYRDKTLKAMFESYKLKPNKPEKQLNELLKRILSREYKYVGDGKLIVDWFNPDFVNCNGQKKIIELYGDYWHSREDAKKRDKKRIKTYTKYGYKTLIIWERELKNLNKLKDKILEFNKNKEEL